MRRVTIGTWLSAAASIALVSCATDRGPTTTAHDGVWHGQIVAPTDCAGAHYWWVDFVVHNGEIRGLVPGTGDSTGRYVIGTVYENGAVHAYTMGGGYLRTVAVRPIDIEFKGDTFTMKGNAQCSAHTVWAGARTGPVPWWKISGF